jgi:hypothetical protein
MRMSDEAQDDLLSLVQDSEASGNPLTAELNFWRCEDEILQPPYTCETLSGETNCLRIPFYYNSVYGSLLTEENWKPFVQSCQSSCEANCKAHYLYEQDCDVCGGFDRDSCDAGALGGAPLATAADSFRYTFSNRPGDVQDFCKDWLWSDSHTTALFRNNFEIGGFLRLTNWYEDRFSPFSEVFRSLQTIRGTVYTVKARVRVKSFPGEFADLQFAPTETQPCASGMVSVEDCPRHDLEEEWGCNGRGAFPQESSVWSVVEFNFTAAADVSYLIFKVRYEAPVEIDFVEVDDTGVSAGLPAPGCECPVVTISNGDANDNAGAADQQRQLYGEGAVTSCILANCTEPLQRCANDAVCSELFPQGLREASATSGFAQNHLGNLWGCVDFYCPIEASLEVIPRTQSSQDPSPSCPCVFGPLVYFSLVPSSRRSLPWFAAVTCNYMSRSCSTLWFHIAAASSILPCPCYIV